MKKDVVHNTSETGFSFGGRILILLGYKLRLDLEIKTNNPIVVVTETNVKSNLIKPNWMKIFGFKKRKGEFHTTKNEE